MNVMSLEMTFPKKMSVVFYISYAHTPKDLNGTVVLVRQQLCG